MKDIFNEMDYRNIPQDMLDKIFLPVVVWLNGHLLLYVLIS